jgi:hypothetical protein
MLGGKGWASARSIRPLLAAIAVLGGPAALPGIAAATPTFLTAQDVSDAGADGFQPQLAQNAAGDILVIYTRFDGSRNRIQAKFRPAGGAYGAAQTLSASGRDASEPQVAFDPSGNAIAVWTRFDGAVTRIESAFRPAGGSFGAATPISAAGQNASAPRLSIDASGRAVAVWERSDGTSLRIEAAVRPPGGAFNAAEVLSEAGEDAFKPVVAAGPAVDANTAVLWTRPDGTKLRVQASRRRDVAGFPRPRGATPLRASLVPAFQECTAPNRSHGAPLSFGSCAGPVQSSSVLTIGSPDANGFAANANGFVLLRVQAGDSGNEVDDADVSVTVSITDVRNRPSGTDYTGRLLAEADLQITDRSNAAETPETGTLQSIPLQIPIDCTATASTTIGSACGATTTIDAVIPGAVPEGSRSIWELGQIVVNDAGPNGTGYASCPPICGDGDEATFMRQGVFAP